MNSITDVVNVQQAMSMQWLRTIKIEIIHFEGAVQNDLCFYEKNSTYNFI